jgi:hypothetical protein
MLVLLSFNTTLKAHMPQSDVHAALIIPLSDYGRQPDIHLAPAIHKEIVLQRYKVAILMLLIGLLVCFLFDGNYTKEKKRASEKAV